MPLRNCSLTAYQSDPIHVHKFALISGACKLKVILTRNCKHRRAAAKPAACAKPLMLSTRVGRRSRRRRNLFFQFRLQIFDDASEFSVTSLYVVFTLSSKVIFSTFTALVVSFDVGDTSVITSLNYGVVIKRIATIDVITDLWNEAFSVSLPCQDNLPTKFDDLDCSQRMSRANRTTCLHLRPVVYYLQNISSRGVVHIHVHSLHCVHEKTAPPLSML